MIAFRKGTFLCIWKQVFLLAATELHPINILHIYHDMEPKLNVRHFADDIFKSSFLNENIWIWIKISVKFVSKGQINDVPVLVQILALTNDGKFTDAYMRHSTATSHSIKC